MLTFKSKLIWAFLFVLATAIAAQAQSLISIRFGSHQGYDRMVCELSGPARYEVRLGKGGIIELHLLGVSVGEKFFLPKLPQQIKLLKSVEAFREEKNDIVLEIRGLVPLDANTTELKGQSWRLALDLSKHVDVPVEQDSQHSDSASTAKPLPKNRSGHNEPAPYVPGDRPMETILADKADSSSSEQHKPEPAKELAHADKPVKHLKREPKAPPSGDDTVKALEVLAEFYDVMGDSDAARDYAREYLERKSGGLEVKESQDASATSVSTWLILAIAFAAGLAGGIISTKLHKPNLKFKFSLPKFKSAKSKKTKFDVEEPIDESIELQEDLSKLERAVASEKKPAAKPAAKPAPVEKEVPQEVVQEAEKSFPADNPATVEDSMKESLMDRRVKRVLELHAENRSLAEIAQDLDMGQDEVKLILDLHS